MKIKNMPGYWLNPITKRWEKTKEDQDIQVETGWEINEENIFQSKFRQGNAPEAMAITKFLVDPKTGKIILTTPGRTHSEALGDSIGQQRAADEFDNYIRAFYDAKNNAVGFRTPYVRGLKENGWKWTEDLQAKAFDIQCDAMEKIRKEDKTIKVAFDISNNDVGKLEQLHWNSLPENKKIIKSLPVEVF